MKKLFVILFLSIMCIIPCGVNAQSMSYRTYSGVVVDKALYDKMCEIIDKMVSRQDALDSKKFYSRTPRKSMVNEVEKLYEVVNNV